MASKRLAYFLALASFLVFYASSSDAQQQSKVFRVGWIGMASFSNLQPRLNVFRETLRSLGYEEGKNLVIDSRFANGDYEQLPKFVSELVRLKVDVIVALGEPILLAAKEKGENTPIVVLTCDPIQKLLGSLARPGGNATGFTCVSSDLVGKRFGLVKSLLPGIRRVAVLYNERENHDLELGDAEAAAQSLGLDIVRFPARTAADFDQAFKRIIEQKCEALYIVVSGAFNLHWQTFAQLALRYRLPAIYGFREFAELGGLLSYGTNLSDRHRRVAAFVDKILKGARPSDLPVEQPTRFELVINLRTARALGLTIPPTLLAVADEVIE
jgi:putative tryptophan/tyrosine transport system substrate-binding protein